MREPCQPASEKVFYQHQPATTQLRWLSGRLYFNLSMTELPLGLPLGYLALTKQSHERERGYFLKGAPWSGVSEQFLLRMQQPVCFPSIQLHYTLHARIRKKSNSNGMKEVRMLNSGRYTRLPWTYHKMDGRCYVQFHAWNDAGNIYAYPAADPDFGLLCMGTVKEVQRFGEFSLSS